MQGFAGLCVSYAVVFVSLGGADMKNNMNEMFTKRFGIEIEMTGITKEKASKIIAETINGTIRYEGGMYSKRTITQPDGRKWSIVNDASIKPHVMENGRMILTGSDYSVELVSPILTYNEDIENLQEIIRNLRKAGAVSGPEYQCGIHIHLDGADHTARSIKNFINIIASKNDLLYKALQIAPERIRWCEKMDDRLVQRIKTRRPKTIEKIRKIWYEDYGGFSDYHYHQSRYHFLNLHSYFTGNHTIELRGFNGTLHAGHIRAYVVLALALNYQALTQSYASTRKPQIENEKFAMRTYLNRIGLIGDDFKNCRKHLYKHLDGVAAWRYGYPEKLKDKEVEK